MQVPAFYSIIGWPVTVMPSFLVLAFCSWLSTKLKPLYFFLISGILFLGVFNNFYNLTLLFFLPVYKRIKLKGFIKIVAFWVLSFLVGFLFSLVMTKLIGGHWGLEIAPWRQPHKILTLSDAVLNAERVIDNLFAHVKLFGSMLVALGGFCSLFVVLMESRKPHKNISIYVIFALIFVALSCYAQAFPLGFNVATRTAFPLFLTLYCLALIIFNRLKIVSILMTLVMAGSCYIINYDSVHYYVTVTNTWLKYVREIASDPLLTKRVTLCMKNEDVKKSEELIIQSQGLKNNLNDRHDVVVSFSPVLKSAGFNDIPRTPRT